jgi:hypothetical protein
MAEGFCSRNFSFRICIVDLIVVESKILVAMITKMAFWLFRVVFVDSRERGSWGKGRKSKLC